MVWYQWDVNVIFHTLRPYDSGLHIHDRLTPLDYEQCGAHTWAWLGTRGAHSHSPNERKGTYNVYGCGEWTGLNILRFKTVEVDADIHKDNNTTSAWYCPPYFPKMPSDRPIPQTMGLEEFYLHLTTLSCCMCRSYEIHVCMCRPVLWNTLY